MFGFIKEKLGKIYTSFSSKLAVFFGKKNIDNQTLQELEALLISSDMGVKITKEILAKLNADFAKGLLKDGQDIKKILEENLLEVLSLKKFEIQNIILLVGVNGSGKTTFAAKLANTFKKQGKKILLIAGDTFRAAATSQLNEWAKKLDVDIEIGNNNQDPSSVVFSGCERFKDKNYDVLIIDTAGRLQSKTNLMKELEKVKKVIQKQLPTSKVSTLLTIDSMLGQNSFEQAQIFNESTNLDGLVLTKMDGTGKAGIVFSIVKELNIPVAYICFGEEVDKIKNFNSHEFVLKILSE